MNKKFSIPLAIVNWTDETVQFCKDLGYFVVDNLKKEKTLLVTNYAGVNNTVGASTGSDKSHLHGRFIIDWHTQTEICKSLLTLTESENIESSISICGKSILIKQKLNTFEMIKKQIYQNNKDIDGEPFKRNIKND